MTTTAAVATLATIPAVIAAGAAATPKITAPTAVIVTPTSISASLSQLNPFFNMVTKFDIAVNAPIATEPIPVIAFATGLIKESALSAAPLPNKALTPAETVVPSVANAPPIFFDKAVDNTAEIPSFAAISTPSLDASEPAIAFEMEVPIISSAVFARCNPRIFLIVSAPIMIPTVFTSRLLKNSFAPFHTSFHEILLNAVVTVSNAPCAHELSVLANNAKSKFWKNLFIPSAIEFPNCFQLNVVPNESNP